VQGELRDRIGSVLEEVARLEHLVSGLLVLSRLDAGEVQGEWTDVDLAELTESTSEQMRLMAEDRGIQIDSSDLAPIAIRGDRGRLKQVIVNLLDNAIRFTPRGGRVTLRASQSGLYNVLEVRDTGIGIPASALPNVFDRFFRVDEARSRDDGGAGLGLSIAKSICSAHGAQIEVHSEVGRGSCFLLRFPRLPVAVVRGAAQAIRSDHARGLEPRAAPQDAGQLGRHPVSAPPRTDESGAENPRQPRPLS